MIKDYIEKGIEEFNEKFGVDETTPYWKGFAKDITDWHTSQQKGLIQKVVEMIEKNMIGECEELEATGMCGHYHGGDTDYNQALYDLKAKLLQEIE